MDLGNGRIVLFCNEKKGTDQLHGHCAADLRLCFCIYKSRFSHDTAQMCKTALLLIYHIQIMLNMHVNMCHTF